jgi:CRISPR-associated endonuclease/helicase Cas3
MRTFQRLLAKSSSSPDNPHERETLPGHVFDVVQSAHTLVTTAGEAALNSLGLVTVFDREVLDKAVTQGALLHDLGKANHQFQQMVRPGVQSFQALRHEWISAWLMLKFPALDQWLFIENSPVIRYAALCAALGHHLKVEDGSSIVDRGRSGETKVTVFSAHPDFRATLRIATEHLGITEPPLLPAIEVDLLSRPLVELRNWLKGAVTWYDESDTQTRHFVALVKAFVVAADVAGSALAKQITNPARWVQEVLERICTAADLQGIATTRLGSHAPRPFQSQVAESPGRITFVKAGCGSGKTAAAYLWAARRAEGKKLFFCYPTTGTATEGYRDYILPSEMRSDAALLHSRSEVDLKDLLDTREGDALERALRIESLAAWDVPLVLCTADQVLGLIQNNRRALFSFPSLANGAFVFDEIHQYDERLFGALLRFLDAFRGAPILLMTASLPRPRLQAIQKILAQEGTTLEIITGPADLEHLPRYELKGLVTEPPWDLIQQTLERGEKVLWVANTVDRAVNFARAAQVHGFSPVLPYHSRYRYSDRIQKHAAVVNAFKENRPGPALAVTTQVCEVSLDLSADLLVSDLAPVPALIQRMGRLNRRVTPDNPGHARPAIFLNPDRSLPYEKYELESATGWLQSLESGPLSQATLAAAFEKIMQDEPVASVESAWLDGGPFSRPAPLREAGVTLAIILAEDEAACVDCNGHPVSKEIIRRTIPMTLNAAVAKEFRGWKQLGPAFVAPAGRVIYSEEWGARWAKQ